ncbi:flagellar assembly protein FliW [Candidatus Poribacteria bacterium]|nr:flagellar assembly protein FliW [Candidatus Poribacteria bacterium]
MEITTSRFGKIKYSQHNAITFFEGLLGFSQFKKYIIVDNKKHAPFQWLQCIEKGNLAFVVTNPYLFKPDYNFSLIKNELEHLNILSKNDLRVFVTVSIPKDNAYDTTINLQGPLFINTRNMIGKQIILYDSGYPIKYSLMSQATVAASG